MKTLSIIATTLVAGIVAMAIVFVIECVRPSFEEYSILTLCTSGFLLMYCVLSIIYFFKKWEPKR